MCGNRYELKNGEDYDSHLNRLINHPKKRFPLEKKTGRALKQKLAWKLLGNELLNDDVVVAEFCN